MLNFQYFSTRHDFQLKLLKHDMISIEAARTQYIYKGSIISNVIILFISSKIPMLTLQLCHYIYTGANLKWFGILDFQVRGI